jgi:DNA-3-methyladenine glycosylase I
MPEYKTPPRAVPADPNGYFESLTKGVFQAGFRWSVVEAKWPGFLDAFHGFDLATVAAYGPEDVERLAANPAIVRNRGKIAGTIENARTLLRIVAEHGSVRAWLDDSTALPWPERKKAVSKPFKSFGPSAAYFFLWSVGEPVPPHNQETTWTEPVPKGYPEAVTA